MSGNIYHEVYEKTKGRPEQDWRPSAHDARWYIFTTVGAAWLVPVDVLAQCERGMKMTEISETSMGFLIPATFIEAYGCERKEHTL